MFFFNPGRKYVLNSTIFAFTSPNICSTSEASVAGWGRASKIHEEADFIDVNKRKGEMIIFSNE